MTISGSRSRSVSGSTDSSVAEVDRLLLLVVGGMQLAPEYSSTVLSSTFI